MQLLMFVVKCTEHIKSAVIGGQRPDLAVITGPETLLSLIRGWMTGPQSLSSLIKDWISRCWHQKSDRRPSFTGIYDVN